VEDAVRDAIEAALGEFGHELRLRLPGPGEPEAQLYSPFDRFLVRVGRALKLEVVPYHQARLPELRVRPDYAIAVDEAVIGYVEIKRWGVGVDNAKFRGHDRTQWQRLSVLPNVLYTDGDSWALYRTGERVGQIVSVGGDRHRPGVRLRSGDGALADLLRKFAYWQPDAPRNVDQLVRSTARLCRLMREEVLEAMALERAGKRERIFLQLAEEWRTLLFPKATHEHFADGYAQTVTFALLLARQREISFEKRTTSQIAHILAERRSPLIGRALEVLTDHKHIDGFDTAVNALVRIVAPVDWNQIAGGKDAPRKFYEGFLEEYDPGWRRRTGSYYTPDTLAASMVRFVRLILQERLGREMGFADPQVVVVDPAMGTGTYLTEIIEDVRRIVRGSQGLGAIRAQLRSLAKRLFGLEKQIGPFAVAEWRLHAALSDAVGADEDLNLFVTDTLVGPGEDQPLLLSLYEPIFRSRLGADRVKRDQQVLVAMGNPPYGERAKRQGHWIVRGDPAHLPPLDDFRAAGRGRQEFKLHNLYVYFWRWATWKVFDAHPDAPSGVIAFISTAGYLRGPGLAGMRRYLRERADEGWIIDLTPEGHRPDGPSRIFAGVQRPVCIGVFVRHGRPRPTTPARVRYRALSGTRQEKIEAVGTLLLDEAGWHECTTDWEDPFAPVAEGTWEEFPPLDDLMPWNRIGVIGNRTWIFAVDQRTLGERWTALVAAVLDEKRLLFKETSCRTLTTRVPPLPGMRQHQVALDREGDPRVVVTAITRRSFDRQWLLADRRVIDRARPELWHVLGSRQVFTSTQHVQGITGGPAVTFGAHVPDAHCYNGRGGRVRPLWLDPEAGRANLAPGLLPHLANEFGHEVGAEELLAYIAGVTAHAGFTRRFREDLQAPGLRVPLTADEEFWSRGVEIGRRVIWLHTYGERFVDPDRDRPHAPLRLAAVAHRPMVREPIPDTVERMPESLDYDLGTSTLHVGAGRISPVAPGVWSYEVSGMLVLRSWFEYRMRQPTIRRSSPLDDIRPREWTSEQTTELLKLLDILTSLVALEPEQEELLGAICSGPLITVSDLEAAGVLPAAPIPGPTGAGSGTGGQEVLPFENPTAGSDEAQNSPRRPPTAAVRRPGRVAGPRVRPPFRHRRTR
jgi:Type ISP C-terminal specificity domain/N-6 DNA Methylase